MIKFPRDIWCYDDGFDLRIKHFDPEGTIPHPYNKYIRASDVQPLIEALRTLVNLNDGYSPFGGEIYQDRIDATWDRARKTLEAFDDNK